MKFSAWLATLSVVLAGCAGTQEITENDGAKIPAFYAAHHTGIVESPTEADLKLAVDFGLYVKDHSEVVQSAYLSRNELTTASAEAFHVVVRTPLYLISRYAMEQDDENKARDPEFLAFARQLRAVKLSLSKTAISSDTWRAYVLDRELVLYRDGVRVIPLAFLPAWKGRDPFEDPNDPLDSWRSTTWLKRGVEEMEEGELRDKQELTAKQKDRLRAGRVPVGSIALEPGDAVFPVAELKRPGRYEIVFRKPKHTPP